MKSPLFFFILLFSLPAISQVNPYLEKTSEIYSSTASALELSVLAKDIWEVSYSLYPKTEYLLDGKYSYYNTSILASTKDFPYQTKVTIKINEGFSIGVGFDPKIYKQTNKVEAVVMIIENGEAKEVDYGIVEKLRIKNKENLYLESITLPNGSIILIQNKLYIKAIKMAGDTKGGMFIIGDYKFLD